jgi:hypothetical protein
MWLSRAVIKALGMDTSDWEQHADAVKEAAEDPSNHPLDCQCKGCM